MLDANKLVLVKWVHTLVWAILVAMIFSILYAGFVDKINFYTWLFIAIIFGEGLVLLFFGLQCPLTIIARKYSDSEKDNFDIYLPNWLARHNKLIFTSVFIVGLILVLWRTIY
jgi:hypothetical protein